MRPDARQTEPVEADILAAYLDRLAAEQRTATYQEAARALGLKPPQTIHRLALALEASMDADTAAGRPLRAASVVSRAGNGRPAAGFFAHARALGRYDGPDAGATAAAFHAGELAAVRARARV
jgi:hypothetical protein